MEDTPQIKHLFSDTVGNLDQLSIIKQTEGPGTGQDPHFKDQGGSCPQELRTHLGI